jgi:hypothetical protein
MQLMIAYSPQRPLTLAMRELVRTLRSVAVPGEKIGRNSAPQHRAMLQC